MKETLNLQNDVSEVKQLAEWIEDIGSRLKLHASVIFKLNLALEEAVVNVIDYAYPGRTGMPISLTAKDCGNKLVFTLTDNGIPFDPTKADEPDVSLSVEDRPVGGLGIFLVKQIMSQITYSRKDGHNTLTMTFNRA
ncbi:MAG: ATP-binding protein [Bacteroidales bacterium]|mgnify:FL=1|nr:ATP-binding protein [Bacteroidales bacterium]MDY3354656.1 ATP-binding protein [Prevotella sp.]MCI7038161.1 ATP-binding protein [Bacteroidales bacterium]MCI7560857.1 ATP-binding protein [Bacteroidales bacterium]MDD6028389.1 ATP-binding protein [Bacteroidales bacterium]